MKRRKVAEMATKILSSYITFLEITKNGGSVTSEKKKNKRGEKNQSRRAGSK